MSSDVLIIKALEEGLDGYIALDFKGDYYPLSLPVRMWNGFWQAVQQLVLKTSNYISKKIILKAKNYIALFTTEQHSEPLICPTLQDGLINHDLSAR